MMGIHTRFERCQVRDYLFSNVGHCAVSVGRKLLIQII